MCAQGGEMLLANHLALARINRVPNDYKTIGSVRREPYLYVMPRTCRVFSSSLLHHGSLPPVSLFLSGNGSSPAHVRDVWSASLSLFTPCCTICTGRHRPCPDGAFIFLDICFFIGCCNSIQVVVCCVNCICCWNRLFSLYQIVSINWNSFPQNIFTIRLDWKNDCWFKYVHSILKQLFLLIQILFYKN